ncbi:MAG: hypothetical protein N2037_04155 [Acidimicrobiales bacterium]|nr:hypothetical protein [Acidimicrobiales bacterium]
MRKTVPDGFNLGAPPEIARAERNAENAPSHPACTNRSTWVGGGGQQDAAIVAYQHDLSSLDSRRQLPSKRCADGF